MLPPFQMKFVQVSLYCIYIAISYTVTQDSNNQTVKTTNNCITVFANGDHDH